MPFVKAGRPCRDCKSVVCYCHDEDERTPPMTNATNAPERIWLQWVEPYHSENTFCEDRINNEDVEYIRADHALALVAAAYEDAAGITPMPPDCAPKGAPVLVSGGLAMKKTDGHWYSGMEEPAFERRIHWEVEWWAPIPNARKLSEFSRTPTDAQAALEAYRKRVREEVLRGAYQNLRTYAPHEDCTTGPEHDIGYAVGYRTAMNRILDLIEGDTDE